MATIADLIATAKEKLETVLAADASAYVDYRIGDKTVSKSQYVRHLLDTITKLSNAENTEVELEFVQFDADIGLDGTDDTQTTVLL